MNRTAFFALLLFAGTVQAQRYPELIGLTARHPGLEAAVLQECGNLTTASAESLLRLEEDISEIVSARGTDEWRRMVCARVTLYQRESPAPVRGSLAGNGTRYDAAVTAAMAAAGNDSSAAMGSHLLALLVIGESHVANPPLVAARLRAVLPVLDGERFAAATLSCVTLALRDRTPGGAECAQTALARGSDSTWHMLALARLAAREGASPDSVTQLFQRAVAARHDSLDFVVLRWHLRWFADPEELEEVEQAPGEALPGMIEAIFVRRDLRDGRELGATLVSHFARLDRIDDQFRLAVSRARAGVARMAASNFAAGTRVGDSVRTAAAWYEPGLIAASPYREFQRWDWRYDDRAYVWARYGEPDRRVQWSASDTTRSLGRRQQVRIRGIPGGNAREVWWYDTPAGERLLQFEVEDFSGSVEATRLVAGGLGSYLCGIETARCNLTQRSIAAFEANWGAVAPAQPIGLPPEALDAVLQDDRATIATVMRTDDNHRDDATVIPFVGSLYRTWSDRCRCWQALVVTAARARPILGTIDSSRTAELRYLVRQWSSTTGSWSTDTIWRRYTLPEQLPDDAWVTDTFTLPTLGGLARWGVTVEPADGLLGTASGRLEPFPPPFPTIVASDLILGSSSQGRSWLSPGGERIALAPLGTFPVDEPVSFYWQIAGLTPDLEYTLTIELIPDGHGGSPLQISSTVTAFDAVEEFIREIDVQQLDPGRYRLRATLRQTEQVLVVREELMVISP